MYINSKKCQTMCITRKRFKPLLSHKLDHENLSTVDSYPYLNVIVSSDSRWNLHINHISGRASPVLTLLRWNIYFYTADTKALAYTSLVHLHLDSFLNQSCLIHLGNAIEIYSAVENVLTLTYLNNKNFHTHVGRPILMPHRQRTIKDRDSIIIISWCCFQCTRGAGGIFFQQFKPNRSNYRAACMH